MSHRVRAVTLALGLTLSCTPAGGQQEPDRSFDTHIARPAFVTRHPRVAIDEAHHNFHTISGRYAPFAALVKGDGCRPEPWVSKFSADSLLGLDVLVISNALGHEKMDHAEAEHSAFTPSECAALRDWVRSGGSLLLIADHSPMGAAASALGDTLGVNMRNSYAIDPVQGLEDSPTNVAYVPGRGLATDHPIMHGRDSTERIRRVVTYTGQSLAGPPGSTVLLRMSDKAEDLLVGLGELSDDIPAEKRKSAAGRAQGLAFELGRGRVVVMAEAAMMTAQVAGPKRTPMGMNIPGTDDRQFALNVVRWLARAL
jgi:hypothetical protein